MGLKNRVQVVLESRRIMDICCQMSAHLKNARFSLFSSFLQAKSAATGIVKTSTFPPPLRKRIQVWEFLKTVSFLWFCDTSENNRLVCRENSSKSQHSALVYKSEPLLGTFKYNLNFLLKMDRSALCRVILQRKFKNQKKCIKKCGEMEHGLKKVKFKSPLSCLPGRICNCHSFT